MSDQGHKADEIARAEWLVSRIRGISACRISTDEGGAITEVHVTSVSRKPPKLVARDVESCLKVELGIEVDYKKIGVVVYDGEDEPRKPQEPPASAGEKMLEFPVDEFASRFAFNSVNLFVSPDTVQAEVELVRDGVETFGSARANNLGEARLRVTSEATLKAVAELLDDDIRLCLSDVSEILVGEDTVVVVKVDVVRNRAAKRLVGCALYSGDTNQTVVFATLDAINRVLGVLARKDEVEYKIK